MVGDRLFHRRLLSELPALVKEGVLDEETARRLAARYEAAPGGERWLFAAFSTLGALLLLGGVILLLAHNWESLGRFTKLALSLAPLATCHALALFIHLTGKNSVAWKEGVGVGMNLSLAAALGLISQVYNLGGTFADFVHYWALLALPIPYATGSVGAALLWCATWLISLGNPTHARDTWQFWPGLLFIAPFLWRTMKTEVESPRSHLASLALAGTVTVGALMSRDFFPDATNFTIFLIATGGAMHLFGLGCGGYSLWKNPFRAIGGLGLSAALFTFSFDDSWRGLLESWRSYRAASLPGWYSEYGYMLLALALAAWSLQLALKLIRRETGGMALTLVLPLFCLLRFTGTPTVGAMAFNLFGVALGVAMIKTANEERSIGGLNAGMALVAGLSVMRFVDSNLPMLARGVAFILLGAAFLAANWYMIRKRRAS